MTDQENTLSDAVGNPLERGDVEALAWVAVEGSLSKNELVSSYIGTLNDTELVEWATDSHGVWAQPFPDIS